MRRHHVLLPCLETKCKLADLALYNLFLAAPAFQGFTRWQGRLQSQFVMVTDSTRPINSHIGQQRRVEQHECTAVELGMQMHMGSTASPGLSCTVLWSNVCWYKPVLALGGLQLHADLHWC